MNIIINAKTSITCVELAELLGLPVLQIITDGQTTQVKLDATESDITADHQAVLAELFDGQTVTVEVA